METRCLTRVLELTQLSDSFKRLIRHDNPATHFTDWFYKHSVVLGKQHGHLRLLAEAMISATRRPSADYRVGGSADRFAASSVMQHSSDCLTIPPFSSQDTPTHNHYLLLNIDLTTSLGIILTGLYILVEPTLGTAKNDVTLKFGQADPEYVSRSDTPLTANVVILGFKGRSTVLRAVASLDIRVCHPLPALTGDVSTELAYPSSKS
ncbi:hypothetical protein J6590_028080 [Homalodisca vitripennis]|nr:hypothetical protein J6590_028080 [Homalodisca vitripennis]